jgi:hypothetical protein
MNLENIPLPLQLSGEIYLTIHLAVSRRGRAAFRTEPGRHLTSSEF